MKKEVGQPLELTHLIKSPIKEVVNNPLRSSTKTQVGRKTSIYQAMRMAPEISGVNVKRSQAIVDNTDIFFFTFKLGFNRCIRKAKKFYLNIDQPFSH